MQFVKVVCGCREEVAQLDEATALALQLFSEDQHPAAFKSGKSSASKEGLSVYALLSRTACPMASHILRLVYTTHVQSSISLYLIVLPLVSMYKVKIPM